MYFTPFIENSNIKDLKKNYINNSYFDEALKILIFGDLILYAKVDYHLPPIYAIYKPQNTFYTRMVKYKQEGEYVSNIIPPLTSLKSKIWNQCQFPICNLYNSTVKEGHFMKILFEPK